MAKRVRTWLQEAGWTDVFLDLDPKEGIVHGKPWLDALDQAVERCAAMVVLVSPSWVASRWCDAEFLAARLMRKLIFPLIVAPTPLKELPQELSAHLQLADISTPKTEAEGFQRLAFGLRHAGLDAGHFDWPPKGEERRSPFRGLAALDEVDAAVFFGRDQLITRGMEDMRRIRAGAPERGLVILGVSGAGKSSYMRAGLLARLRRDDANFAPLGVIRPERAVIGGEAGFAAALESALTAAGERVSRAECEAAIAGGASKVAELLVRLREPTMARLRTLAKAARERFKRQPPTVVIPIDQGEELFDARHEEAAAFVALIAELVAIDPACAVLATLRSGAYGQWQSEPHLGTLKHIPLNLPILSLTEFKLVIEGPVGLAKPPLAIEHELTERLIADIGGGDALPLLAFTLEQLATRYGGSGKLTLKSYVDGLGGLQGAIAAAAESVIKAAVADPALPNDRDAVLALVGRVFIPHLVAIDDATREPRRLVANVSDIPADARPLVHHLVDARLLVETRRAQGDAAADVVDVAHEAILRQWPALAAMIAAQQEALIRLSSLSHAAAEWDRSGRAEAWLHHSGDRLAEAQALAVADAFKDAVDKDKKVKAYLVACAALAARLAAEEQAQKDREAAQIAATRRFQRLAGWLILFTGLVVLAGLGWIVMRDRALNANASKSLAALSQDWASQGRWDRALRLAIIGTRGYDAPLVGFDPTDAEAALRRAATSLRTTAAMQGASGIVATAVFTQDGTIVSGGQDLIGRVWDAKSGALLHALPRGTGWIINISVSKRGHCAVTAAAGETGARLWDFGSGRQIAALNLTSGQVHGAACSADGTKVITTGEGDTAIVWDLATRSRLQTLKGHAGQVLSVAFSDDGQWAATGSTDTTVRIWNLATGEPAKVLNGHTGNVVTVNFSPDSKRLVSASLDHTALVWDVAAGGKPLLTLAGQEKGVESAEFSPNGALVATAGQDGTTRLYDAATGLELRRITGATELVNSAYWSPDGGALVTASDEGLVKTWRLDPGRSLDTGAGLGPAIFLPGDRQLLIATNNGDAEAWDIASGAVTRKYGAHTGPVLALAMSRDGAMVATAGADGVIDVASTADPAASHKLVVGAGEVRSVAFMPDGKRLVSAGADGELSIWDLTSQARIGAPVRFAANEGKSLAVSPDGRMIATSSRDNDVRLWDGATLTPLGDLAGHTAYVNTLAFSPDSKRLVTASNDSSAIVWDVTSQKPIAHLTGDTEDVTDAVFSADGKEVLTASNDRSARIWDAATGNELYRLETFSSALTHARFSNDGQSIVTVSEDKVARITPLSAFEDPQLLDGNPQKVMSRACGGYLQNGVQALEPYEQGMVSALTSRRVTDACRDPGGANLVVWALGLLFAVAAAGGWWLRRQYPRASLRDLAGFITGRSAP